MKFSHSERITSLLVACCFYLENGINKIGEFQRQAVIGRKRYNIIRDAPYPTYFG